MKNSLLLLLSALVATPLCAQQVSLQQHVTAETAVKSVSLSPSERSLGTQATKIKTIAGGKMGHIDLMRDANGRVFKQLVRTDNRTLVPGIGAKKAATAEVGSLYEDFGGWDGETKNWIPEDWTDIESQDPTIQADPASYTWHVEANPVGFLANPEKGDYQASIYLAIDYDTYSYGVNDDWLISPEFTPAEGEILQYSLSFTPFWMFDSNYLDWDLWEFTDYVRTASVQTYLKVDGGEWTLLHDPYDDYVGASMDVLFEDGLDNSWRTYRYDMSEYVGKTLQVAFRYEGVNGENWSVDYAACAAPSPEACYIRPNGAFYMGLSKDYSNLASDGLGLMLLPGNTNVTWTNTSNADAQSFTWTYDYKIGTTELGTSNDVDLTVAYEADPEQEYNWYYLPELTAEAPGAAPSIYSWNGYCLQAGGYAHYLYSGETEETLFGVGNYDLQNKITILSASEDAPLFGIGSETNASWSTIYGKEVTLNSVGNYFEKPETAYTLKSMEVLCLADGIADDAQLEVVLKRVQYGYLTDTIAVGRFVGSEAYLAFENGGYKYYALPFTFVTKDEDGFESETELTIEDAFIAFLNIKDATGIDYLACLQSFYPDAQEECNGYFYLGNEDGTESLKYLASLSTSQGTCYNSFLFNLYLNYPIESAQSLNAVSNAAVKSMKSFNLAGQPVDANAKGFVIMQGADGKMVKMLNK